MTHYRTAQRSVSLVIVFVVLYSLHKRCCVTQSTYLHLHCGCYNLQATLVFFLAFFFFVISMHIALAQKGKKMDIA